MECQYLPGWFLVAFQCQDHKLLFKYPTLDSKDLTALRNLGHIPPRTPTYNKALLRIRASRRSCKTLSSPVLREWAQRHLARFLRLVRTSDLKCLLRYQTMGRG